MEVWLSWWKEALRKSNYFIYNRLVWQGVTAISFPFPISLAFFPQLFSILSSLLYTSPCVSLLPLLLLLIHFSTM